MSKLVTVQKARNIRTQYRWHEVTIGHADLTDADTSQVIDIATDNDGTAFPTNCRIHGAWLRVHTDFAGGTVSALVCKVGDAGGDNELIADTSVFTGASNVLPLSSNVPAALPRWETAYAPIATFTSTTDNLVNLTAGSLTVCILLETVELV